MERKRKLPARAARGVEPVSKKRTSTPPEQAISTPTPPPPPPVEETLPRSIAPGKPLPTIEEPQPDNLPANQYQTIPESGVLVDSLHRSRQKWLSEGIFERYWTKPTKKKGAPDAPPDNPPKDSMTKLGSCSVTVEPHTFEATMYAIKDPNPKPLLTTLPPQQQMYRPIIQYGPPGGVMPPNPPPAVIQRVHSQTPPVPQAIPRSQDVHMQNTTPAPPNNTSSINTPLSTLPTGHRPTPAQTPSTTKTPQPAPPSNNKSTDPVIQMLAERAATDPSLKALMRIVANGEANAEELKRFQSHIDELTELTRKSRQAADNVPPPPTQAPSNPQTNGNTLTPIPALNPPTQVKVAPTPPPPAPTPVSQFQPQSQALRSKGPVPSTKPDISGVVFEFTGGNGDRYLFPKFSILETRPSGEVIVSFLIVRKGSKSDDSRSYDPELDYYQPVTIRVHAHQPRQLDALQKVVERPEEVRKYMNEVMDRCTRAEYVLLAMRLPKDVDQGEKEKEKEDEAEKGDAMDYQVTPWATTTTTMPVVMSKSKPVKKVLTEDEVYKNFIASVS